MRHEVNRRVLEYIAKQQRTETHNGYTILKTLEDFESILRKVKKKYIYDNHLKYLRVPAGFDIETTRVDTKAYMYHWQFSFGKYVICGRKWSSFAELVAKLQTWLTWQKATIIVWVANLGHEFSFMCSRFEWSNIFAVAPHEPLKARTGRVEFRECLSISGAGGLKNLAKHYTQTQKAVSDLDYTVMRNSQTELDETERGYCYCDVEILSEWGTYIFENFADLGLQIPLTATGIVRSHIKKAAQDTGKYEHIKDVINKLYPQTPQEYDFIMEYLFRGGYTHACVYWCNMVCDDIIGADFTSSYPAVMLHDNCYQCSPFVKTTLETDGQYITDYRLQQCCVWFVATFTGIESTSYHSIESKHKLCSFENAQFDNGRLIGADRIQVALTETDYRIYTLFYKWKSIDIQAAYVATKGKLPEYVLKPLRHFYKIKSRLKKAGQDGTIEYQNAKAICNSMYGCCVTRLKFRESLYDAETHLWYQKLQDKSYDELRKNQILSPYWGIQITSAARAHLLETVWKLENSPDESGNKPDEMQVLYCDTDSAYMLDSPRNRAIIAEYNAAMFEINKDLDPEFFDIGAFDWIDKDKDGNPIHYKFKTLGAKRYVKYHDGIASVTVAGLPKGSLEKMLAKPFAKTDDCYIAYKDPKKKKGRIGFVSVNELFDSFNDNMLMSVEWSEKTRAAYHPETTTDIVTDEQGHTEEMTELSSVAIVPVQFQMKVQPEYMRLIEKILSERRLLMCYENPIY